MMIQNPHIAPAPRDLGFRTNATRPLALLRDCPAYAPTPLLPLPELATDLGIAQLWAKDETARLRLGSFKALGGAFALVRMILDRAGTEDITDDRARTAAAAMTFVTASAGNHGLSVAAGARLFGARARILLATDVPEDFARRIRDAGADVGRVAGSYEDSVAQAMHEAETNGWIHLADGSWPGYTHAPALVMEGYTVLAHEATEQFRDAGTWPDHILLQAGVGGIAAAVAAHIRAHWPEQPHITVVEPEAAACLMRSAQAGELTHAAGPVSNMGRLDCKDASMLAFGALSQYADSFVTITDAQAQAAADRLTRAGLATTPSGAAGLAGIEQLSPGAQARCMIVATEGPTAPT